MTVRQNHRCASPIFNRQQNRSETDCSGKAAADLGSSRPE